MGYVNFGKPDVHIIKIFEATDLVAKKSTNYQALKAIVRVSENIGVSAYTVYKLF